jgi:uncharacterized protein
MGELEGNNNITSERVKAYQVFLKPVGSSCNLRCSYCYYLGKRNCSALKRPANMSEDILERFIIQHFETTEDDVINFSWHGGEPLIAGLSFFRRAIKLQNKHLPPGKKVVNGIQTNGTLINSEFCSFFSDNGFVAGISIDGPANLHDLYRKTPDGKGSFERVLKGFELLKKFEITTEILCVVHSGNVDHPDLIYDFFKQLGALYITFLPLVIRNGLNSDVSTDSVVALDFGLFLSKIFDQWVEHDIGRIKIQIFEEMLRPAFDQEHTLCIFKKECGRVPVVDFNGDFYSCDHYVDEHHMIGNISEGHLSGFLESEEQKEFGRAKYKQLPGYCKSCNVRPMCNGECPKNRFISTPDGEDGLNYLCKGYKYFFNHCLPFIGAVREAWKNQK